MNTSNHHVIKDYFALTIKLAVDERASKYVPLHNLALTSPLSYQLASVTPNKPSFIVLIVLLHLLVFIGIAKNHLKNSDTPSNLTPMLVRLIHPPRQHVIEAPAVAEVKPKVVRLINSPKPKLIEAPVVAEVQPKVEQKIAVATQEVSTLPANEKPEIKPSQLDPVSERASSSVTAIPESPKKSEQKSESEVAFEPPRFNADYLHNPAPEYPAMSRRRGEQGRLTLRVVVNINGDAENVQLDKSSGFELLDKAAITAVKGWKFVPAKNNNQPVSGTVIVPVRFSLDS